MLDLQKGHVLVIILLKNSALGGKYLQFRMVVPFIPW